MYFKNHIVRMENVKTLQALDAANICHKVIAMFMTSEGVPLKEYEMSAILNSFNQLGMNKVSHKKAQVLIDAKHESDEDETLPCPV